MAATVAGRRLTARHRTLQLALRARFVREFLSLAGAWNGDARSFALLVAASIPLVTLRNQESSALALRYHNAFRAAELGASAGSVRLAAARPPTPDTVRAGMWAAGQNQIRRSLAAGMSAEAARRAALVRVTGATARNVLNGARDTTLRNVQTDQQARGWQRVTAGSPCAFCVTAASSGPRFRSEGSASFQAHSGCACTAEPVYASGAAGWSDQALQHRVTYQRAQREAREAGELDRGTSNDALNATRRLLARSQ